MTEPICGQNEARTSAVTGTSEDLKSICWINEKRAEASGKWDFHFFGKWKSLCSSDTEYLGHQTDKGILFVPQNTISLPIQKGGQFFSYFSLPNCLSSKSTKWCLLNLVIINSSSRVVTNLTLIWQLLSNCFIALLCFLSPRACEVLTHLIFSFYKLNQSGSWGIYLDLCLGSGVGTQSL